MCDHCHANNRLSTIDGITYCTNCKSLRICRGCQTHSAKSFLLCESCLNFKDQLWTDYKLSRSEFVPGKYLVVKYRVEMNDHSGYCSDGEQSEPQNYYEKIYFGYHVFFDTVNPEFLQLFFPRKKEYMHICCKRASRNYEIVSVNIVFKPRLVNNTTPNIKFVVRRRTVTIKSL